ncbi:MAG TPA: phage tail sheath family protein, partial [Beijerinckiaceae bacterium]|nr:phage tail sheath family protein [Beijerinckiaceae bacterium]
MPEYLAPGVFIEEIERGPRPIEGVATSTAAFLGETERGRTKPRLVTSFNEYRRHFGSAFAEGKYMPDALSGFFDNGGRRAYVCRIVGANAA